MPTNEVGADRASMAPAIWGGRRDMPKISRDLDFLINCLHEVLVEQGEGRIASLRLLGEQPTPTD